MSKATDDKPRCRTCAYWAPLTPHVGLCTAEPPALGPLDEATGLHPGIWPSTEKHKSCGRHPDLALWIENRA